MGTSERKPVQEDWQEEQRDYETFDQAENYEKAKPRVGGDLGKHEDAETE